MPISRAVLMCHAPIVIPAIGRERAAQCARTTDAMRHAATRLVTGAPDVLVVISPHAPRDRARWGICAASSLAGDFARFGAPEVGARFAGAPAAAGALAHAAHAANLATWSLPGDGLDHGSLVPLYFVHEAGWRGATLLIALPYPGTGSEAAMGRAVRNAAESRGERWAILASGDMSHRLLPDAPAGFHPRARDFDARFRDAVAAGDLRTACAVDEDLREIAAEDVVDSCAVAAGAVDFDATGHEVIAYEGPFGVGYLEAVLFDAGATDADTAQRDRARAEAPPRELLRVARDAIAAHLHGRTYRPPWLDEPWSKSRGVFVTLRTSDGALRGCIGHIDPVHATLADEVASVAVSSAMRDTRFAPVRPDELDSLAIELSVLAPPEHVGDLAALDPERYGVIVSQGERRGVLLPAIEGVTDAHHQIRIAAQKDGIALDAPFDLERFEVQKIGESPRGAVLSPDAPTWAADARARMVEAQLRARGIADARVLAAMGAVPRENFVPDALAGQAYDDCALPIGHGQTISQPFMVARSLEVAALGPADRVLEVGAGSGYQAALLGHLCASAVAVELVEALATRARERIAALGLANVEVAHGDGSRGWPASAPYDAILVAAGAPRVPDALVAQLAEGGRLVIPVGTSQLQILTVLRKRGAAVERTTHEACVFVPLLGDY
jgi:protein-L-isoaspartate(D-aspartate) O-methyltransferase